MMHGLRHSTRTRYRCSVQFEHGTDRTGHTTRRMEPMDEYVREAVAAFLSDPVNLRRWRTRTCRGRIRRRRVRRRSWWR
ncbi:hypothetical protein GY12_26740 [Micrococcus luteus]|nr:hypothetical protein GY12_26740 [Micrococcus luteus]